MTPRRSRGRRLVLVAVAAVVLVLAACSEVKNNGQNSLAAQGPARPEDLQPLHADPDHRDRRRHRDHRRHGLPRDQVPLPRRARTRTRSRSTATPGSRSAGRSSPRCCSPIVAVPTVAHDLRPRPEPRARARCRSPSIGKQWWWQFEYPDAKVVTADELIIPTGRDVFVHLNACDGSGDREDLQRDPQLLGARAARARRTSCPARPTRSRSTPTNPAPTSGSARSTAGCRTPTCASG